MKLLNVPNTNLKVQNTLLRVPYTLFRVPYANLNIQKSLKNPDSELYTKNAEKPHKMGILYPDFLRGVLRSRRTAVFFASAVKDRSSWLLVPLSKTGCFRSA